MSDARIEVRLLDGVVPALSDGMGLPGGGALVTFRGVVRPEEEGREIEGLTYETYDPMAERILRELAERVCDARQLLGMRALHSRGFVPAGACSFLLEVTGRHRREALDGMDDFIDGLKRDVPIWKKPVHTGAPAPGPGSP